MCHPCQDVLFGLIRYKKKAPLSCLSGFPRLSHVELPSTLRSEDMYLGECDRKLTDSLCHKDHRGHIVCSGRGRWKSMPHAPKSNNFLKISR